jgi:Na+/H+-dicarboxylate symporter
MRSTNTLTRRIMVAMVLGVLTGYVCHRTAADLEAAKALAGYFSIATDIFLRMIKMIVAPLVFATLVSGIASMDDTKAIGRIGAKALAWFLAASLASASIGLVFVDLTQPGVTMKLPLPAASADVNLPTNALNLKDFITHIFPKSIFEAMAHNEIIQILVFSLFFGVALSKISGSAGQVLRHSVDALMDVMLRITNAVMLFAPVGIFAALAAAVTVQGLGVLATYGKFIGCFYLALACLWMVLCITGHLLLKQRLVGLLKAVREPVMIAFSTASSEAAYPKMLEQLQRFGVKKRLVGFVLPLGYSFNLSGSMVYQAFAAIFVAQAFDIQMSFSQQVMMLLVLMISSKGMAAVPRGSLVVVAAVLPMFGLPEAGLLLVMGIDQFLDMGRTATNVLGNSIATAVVAKWEGELGPERQTLDEETSSDSAPIELQVPVATPAPAMKSFT